MENLPVEILQHISLFMDDRARRFMRLASTKWFKIINYNNFTCYFTTLQSLKELSARLSKYQNQNISLTLLKSSPIDETQLIDNISILTNLVSLSLDSYFYVSRHRDQWIKLTSLTKLNYLDIKVEYPIELAKRLTQLTSPKFDRFNLSFVDVAEVLALNSNIQSLEIATRSSNQIDVFASIANPSILTKLKVDYSRTHWIEPNNEFSMSKLINLKWLEYYEYRNIERCFPIGSLTSLEYLSLTVDQHLSEQFDQNTNLTGLEITSKYATAQYLENISKLTKLQKLSLKTPRNSSAYKFLTALTVLSDFTLWYFAQDIHETLSLINTAQLTRLSVTFAPTTSTCDPICRFTSLQELILRTDAIININYSSISTLTNLTTLYLLLEANNIDCLLHLKKLKHLVIDSTDNQLLNGVDFRSLPDLEMLEGPLLDSNTFNSLVSATNLTSLKIHLSDEIKTYNYSILTRLPLQEFINNAKTNNDDTLWRALGQITTLEAISQQSLDSDEKLLYLTKLSRLTSLKIFHSENMTGKHLTALTSIQVLTFKSARSIFSSHNDPYKMRIELDNLEIHLPYLYSKQL